MKWAAVLATAVSKLPIERLLVRPDNRKRQLQELQAILTQAHATPATPPPADPEVVPAEEEQGVILEPRRPRVHLAPAASEVTTAETVTYQNREIAKNLVVLEKHYTQKLTIAGKRCDCGAGRHLLAIEALAEEAIPMVDNPEVYYRLTDWCREASPKSTTEAAKSTAYDEDYVIMAREARDFRKEIIGTLEVSALYPKGEDANESGPIDTREPAEARSI